MAALSPCPLPGQVVVLLGGHARKGLVSLGSLCVGVAVTRCFSHHRVGDFPRSQGGKVLRQRGPGEGAPAR